MNILNTCLLIKKGGSRKVLDGKKINSE